MSDEQYVELFDFTKAGSVHAWRVINDDVMGGVSSSHFEGTTHCAVFSGVVSLENNGGFASARSQPARHDLSGCESIVLRVRGDGRRYKFTVRTAMDVGAPVYQCTFQTEPGQWQGVKLLLKDFVPTFRGRVLRRELPMDPSHVASVGLLISDQQSGRFRLEIVSIRAIRREAGTVSDE